MVMIEQVSRIFVDMAMIMLMMNSFLGFLYLMVENLRQMVMELLDIDVQVNNVSDEGGEERRT